MKARKSWREKMESPNLPKLVAVPPKWRQRYGTGTMLVPSPREVDDLIRKVPRGRLISVSEIRDWLAQMHGANVTCPLTTGIFVWLAAEAAEEAAREGNHRITPYWRVVKDDGTLNPKFPGGVRHQAEMLQAEGHQIAPGKGKRPPRVVSYTTTTASAQLPLRRISRARGSAA
jgi:hypothetical protein